MEDNYHEVVRPIFDFMAEIYIYEYNVFTPYRIEKYDESLEKLKQILEDNKEKYIQKSSRQEYLIEKMRLNTFAGNVEMLKHSLMFPVSKVRAETNVENIKLLSEIQGENNKLIIWAHNGHVTSDEYLMQEFFNYTTDDGFHNINMESKESLMGYLLKRDLGESYFNIGFEFYEGNFTAIEYKKGIKEFSVSAPESNTLPYLLNRANVYGDCYFLSLNKNNMDKTVFNYFNSSQFCHEIGAAYISRYVKKIPQTSYDALIFIKNTTGTTML